LKKAREVREARFTKLEGRGEGEGVSELRGGRVLGINVVTLHAQALPHCTPNGCHVGDLN
jgi:hypothetical protein